MSNINVESLQCSVRIMATLQELCLYELTDFIRNDNDLNAFLFGLTIPSVIKKMLRLKVHERKYVSAKLTFGIVKAAPFSKISDLSCQSGHFERYVCESCWEFCFQYEVKDGFHQVTLPCVELFTLYRNQLICSGCHISLVKNCFNKCLHTNVNFQNYDHCGKCREVVNDWYGGVCSDV